MSQKASLNRSSNRSSLNKPSSNYNLPQQKNTRLNSILEAGTANILLPLRLFLGISFVAAGLDKLFDPQFFDPTAGGYIGNQLAGFAGHSPLGIFLTNIAVPQATIFGALVLIGELGIGLGTIIGLFSRTAAFFGFLLSIALWLTASWSVTPFFLGSDLPYAMGWLTLFLAGSHPVLSLDARIKNRSNDAEATAPISPIVQNRPGVGVMSKGSTPYPGPGSSTLSSEEKVRLARRQFLTVTGGTILAGALTGVAWAHSVKTNLEGQSTAASQLTPPLAASTAQSTPSNQPTAPASAPVNAGATAPATAASSTPASSPNSPAATQAGVSPTPTQTPVPQPAIKGPVIGKLATIAIGTVLAFKTPNTGESAYLVHEKDGSVKAFSRICTHEGCEVSFNQNNQIFLCPCHGAQFDAKTGAALRGPTRQPLQNFAVQVDGSGNIIYTA